MSAETLALEQFFQAVNRNDMEAITKDFHPEIVRIEPEGFPTAGTYRGVLASHFEPRIFNSGQSGNEGHGAEQGRGVDPVSYAEE